VRVRVEEFASRIKRELQPLYILYGDEPLLVQECADALRARCREEGFSERRVFDADAQFDWGSLLAECGSLSLFAERKLIEVRLPGCKPGTEGGSALREVARQTTPDTVMLILAGKPERDTEKSAWFKALDEAGVSVRAWAVRRQDLPGWITQRLRAAGFRPTPDAVALLAERVEGNLLAANQEIQKLALLAEPGALDAATLAALVADSARYSTFDLCDRTMEGDCAAAVRTLDGLRAEGVDSVLVLWALADELRRLLRIARRRADGESAELAQRSERGKAHSESALRRLGTRGLLQLLRRAAEVDRCIKGLDKREPWDALLGMVIFASGGFGRRG